MFYLNKVNFILMEKLNLMQMFHFVKASIYCNFFSPCFRAQVCVLDNTTVKVSLMS